ncbi:MAG: hypothetical protein HQ485_14350 [Acidobacteria bacterium]|jgi:hypothetical protein|nr:hypothetical protein [Acidobacteriota bacterium]
MSLPIGAQRKQLSLLAILVITAAAVLYYQLGGTAEVAGVASNTITAPRPSLAAGALPEGLRLASLEPVPEETDGSRNPFGFGVPPRPAIQPPAPPTPRPPQTVQPPRPTGPLARLQIPVKFLGYAEDPTRPGKLVSLSVDGAVTLAREGDVVDGRYRLLKVGLESIVMAYLDGQGQQTIRQSGT